ncbi:MAG: hypothetical protein ACFFCZ_28990 [Promethearchaeota archaeon]
MSPHNSDESAEELSFDDWLYIVEKHAIDGGRVPCSQRVAARGWSWAMQKQELNEEIIAAFKSRSIVNPQGQEKHVQLMVGELPPRTGSRLLKKKS